MYCIPRKEFSAFDECKKPSLDNVTFNFSDYDVCKFIKRESTLTTQTHKNTTTKKHTQNITFNIIMSEKGIY